MDPQLPTRLEHRVVAAAEAQLGVISRAQLVALGCTPDWINGRRKRGWLRLLHRGVYAVGHAVLLRQGWWIAAGLAVPGGALGYRSAGVFHRLSVSEQGPVELLIEGDMRSRPGIIVRRTRALSSLDVFTWHGMPVTRLERTLIDLADLLLDEQLIRAADSVPHVSKPRLIAALDRAGPRRARTRLAFMLEDGPRTRSELERAFVRFCRRFGYPTPRCNVRVAGGKVDAYWPEHRLVVECDSRGFHNDWEARQKDIARDRRVQALGLRVVRLTWTDLVHFPDRGAAALDPFLPRVGR